MPMVTCQKCGKAYEPKRRGGKFCSTTCRVSHYQLLKRGGSWIEPAVRHERYLADKLIAVGESADKVLQQVKGLPAEQELAALKQLVLSWRNVANNSIIEQIKQTAQA